MSIDPKPEPRPFTEDDVAPEYRPLVRDILRLVESARPQFEMAELAYDRLRAAQEEEPTRMVPLGWEEEEPDSADSGEKKEIRLNPADKSIIEALEKEAPMQSVKIARLAGVSKGYARQRLARLVKEGVLKNDGEGYSLNV